ncbi:PxKF domain-containing protein [Ornithinimicrobium cavernae]|uniref:PxKF domain-containing protein n=1 Tax=Ornithinimicrobium cavernae TaxID=2666047 RepID=UPI000D6935D6|nr:PxKF domain-containing protein [Ornithinimicrobium cavernae]
MRPPRSAAAGILLLALLAPLAASAQPIDPIVPEPDPGPGSGFTPPEDGFSWLAPERFREQSPGHYNFRWVAGATASDGHYETDYVRPESWPIEVNGCRTAEDYAAQAGADPVPTLNTYTFITAHDGHRISGPECLVTLDFPSEGSYDVRMLVNSPEGVELGAWEQTVTVNDLLIVQIGDSYGSGEGAVEWARGPDDQYGRWVDDRCHRSSYAASAQAARDLERADPRTTVTYLSFACSGGTIDRDYQRAPGMDQPIEFAIHTVDPYFYPADAPIEGSGVLGRYRGVQPDAPDDYSPGAYIPSQMAQLHAALVAGVPEGQVRQIDALMVSAGGNDAGFGPLAAACVVHDNCLHPKHVYTDPRPGATSSIPLALRVQLDMGEMPARYDRLAMALDGLGVPISDTYITEYPDPGTEFRTDGGGSPVPEECEEILEDVKWEFGMEIEGRQWVGGVDPDPPGPDPSNTTELGFARFTFMGGLNAHIRQAAARHDWHYVGGVAEAFQGHGYCVGANDDPDVPDRWIQTAAVAELQQGPKGDRSGGKGTLHPNRRGNQAVKEQILITAQEQLTTQEPDGGVHHRFDPTAPTATAVVDPRANVNGWHTDSVEVTLGAVAGGRNTLHRVEWSVDGAPQLTSATVPVAVPVTREGVSVVRYRAVDTAENSSPWQEVTVQIDRVAPSLEIIRPVAVPYTLDEAVTIDFTCADEGSGVSSCLGSAAVGTALDTATVGEHRFTVEATDLAGHDVTEVVDYQVWYPFGGMTLNGNNGAVPIQAGSTVVIRLDLGGDRGPGVIDLSASSSQAVACDTGQLLGERDPIATKGQLHASYSSGRGEHSVDWATDKTWRGTCRELALVVADGSVRTVLVTFR